MTNNRKQFNLYIRCTDCVVDICKIAVIDHRNELTVLSEELAAFIFRTFQGGLQPTSS
jgi:hypothetical protein